MKTDPIKRGPKAARGDDARRPVAIVLSHRTVAMLDEMAREAGVSRSHVVRQLIEREYEGDRHETVA